MADGFEEAFLGIATQAGGNPLAVYDREKCIQILMRDMADAETAPELLRETAEDYFGFNTECAHVGPSTPMFLEPFQNLK